MKFLVLLPLLVSPLLSELRLVVLCSGMFLNEFFKNQSIYLQSGRSQLLLPAKNNVEVVLLRLGSQCCTSHD